VPAQGDWRDTWQELARWRALEPGTAEERALARELNDRTVGAGVRGTLLAACLAARGESGAALEAAQRLTRRLDDRRRPWPLDAEESFLAASVLPPGPEHVRATLEGLAGVPEPTRAQLEVAFQAGVDEARALSFAEGAVPIQRALHERYRAPWTAMNLALSLRQDGRRDEADAVYAAAIAAEEAAGRSAAALWSQRGILWGGAGDEGRARSYLGRALSEGSADAGIVLAWMELGAGRPGRAREGFRAALDDAGARPWALRGFGLTLLPPIDEAALAKAPAEDP